MDLADQKMPSHPADYDYVFCLFYKAKWASSPDQ